MTLSKFIDENYDGVVIKLPSFFISLNKIDIAAIGIIISKAEYSLMHPDYVNSLYEIKNMDYKKQFLKEQKENQDKRKANDESRLINILNGNIILIDTDEVVKVTLTHDNFYINDIDYGFDDYFTNKLNIKASFITSFKKEITTAQSFVKFIQQSCSGCTVRNLESAIINMESIRFKAATFGAVLQISFNLLSVRIVKQSNSSTQYRYTSEYLYKDNNGYFIDGNTKRRFDGYTFHGSSLIKDNIQL